MKVVRCIFGFTDHHFLAFSQLFSVADGFVVRAKVRRTTDNIIDLEVGTVLPV